MFELILAALVLPIVIGLITLPQKNLTTIRYTNLAGSALTSGIILAIICKITEIIVFSSEFLYVDYLSAVLLLVVALLTFTATLFSLPYMEKEVKEGHATEKMIPRYYALLNLFTFAMVSVLVVGNLGLMWVAVEGTTLASALLVAFYFNRSALEAAWKYVMICTVGICLALLGTMILYYAQVNAGGETQALNWLYLKQISNTLNPTIVKLAFVFILIGYGTKAGLAPMHTWLPDAHSQAPSPVSGLLSGALLSCAFYALIRNVIIIQGTIGTEFIHTVLLGLGILSILLAIPFVLIQHDVKRLLAYSSVEHMGIIAIGFGIGSHLAVYAALLHIINHAIAKSALFYLVGIISQEYKTRHIKEIQGIARVMPTVATMFIIGILAITGTPPLNIFISKFLLINAMFESNMWLLGGLALLLLVGVFAGLMNNCLKMTFSSIPEKMKQANVSPVALTAIGFSIVLMIVGGIYLPTFISDILTKAAEIVIGG